MKVEERHYISGYSGHKPQNKFKENQAVSARISKDPNNFQTISGYAGFMQHKKSENIFGKTFNVISKEIKNKGKFCTPENKFAQTMTTQRESFMDPKRCSTSNYVSQIFNKDFFRVRKATEPDPNNLMAIKIRDRLNKTIEENKQKIANDKETKNQEDALNEERSPFKGSQKVKFEPILGYAGHYPQLVAGGVHGSPWTGDRKGAYKIFLQNLKQRGTKMPQRIKPLRNLKNKSIGLSKNELCELSAPEILHRTQDHISEIKPEKRLETSERKLLRKKSLDPIIGYSGHIRAINATDNVGMSFMKCKKQASHDYKVNNLLKPLKDKEDKAMADAFEEGINYSSRNSSINRQLMGRTMHSSRFHRNVWK